MHQPKSRLGGLIPDNRLVTGLIDRISNKRDLRELRILAESMDDSVPQKGTLLALLDSASTSSEKAEGTLKDNLKIKTRIQVLIQTALTQLRHELKIMTFNRDMAEADLKKEKEQ